MIFVIAILWLLAVYYTVRKRSRQIQIMETKIKERYEQKSQKDESQETEKESSKSKPT